MNRQRTPPRNTKRQSSPKRSRTEQPRFVFIKIYSRILLNNTNSS